MAKSSGRIRSNLTSIAFVLMVLTLSACALPGASAPAAGQDSADNSTAADSATLDLPLDVDVQTVASIMNRDDVLLIDVREPWEYDEGHIPGISLIPMGSIAERLDEIPMDVDVIVTCRSGNRSGKVTDYLRQQGYSNVHNMEGGIVAWQQAGLDVAYP